jgi:hypothetical protein
MQVAAFLVGYVVSSLAARGYRAATGVWVPGWIGGISLLGIFTIFAVLAVALGAPIGVEYAFFAVIGLHIGAFVGLSRRIPVGQWWQIWR